MQWTSSLFQILASTALTVWTTLKIIEVSLRKDKERQWKGTRILTYNTILATFRTIFLDSGTCAFFVVEDDWGELHQLFGEISANKGNMASLMVRLAVLMENGYIKGGKDRFNRDASEYIKGFKESNENIKKHFNLITFSLIPRIQQFSEDDHINKKMLILEIYYKRFEELADLQNRNDSEFLYFMIPSYVHLLNAVGLIYDDIYRELQRESVDTHQQRREDG
jgi:hypothetical protein